MTLKDIYEYINKKHPEYGFSHEVKHGEEIISASLHETEEAIDVSVIIALINNDLVITFVFDEVQTTYKNLKKINYLNNKLLMYSAYIDTSDNAFKMVCVRQINDPREANRNLEIALKLLIKYKKYLPDFYNTNKMD